MREKLESVKPRPPPGYVAPPQHIAKIKTYADAKRVGERSSQRMPLRFRATSEMSGVASAVSDLGGECLELGQVMVMHLARGCGVGNTQ